MRQSMIGSLLSSYSLSYYGCLGCARSPSVTVQPSLPKTAVDPRPKGSPQFLLWAERAVDLIRTGSIHLIANAIGDYLAGNGA